MCGSEGRLLRAMIEGTELKVCGKCSKFGNVLGPVITPINIQSKERKIENVVVESESEVMEIVSSDFSSIIRRKRENIRMNQKEFAMKINEKESVVHKIENGEFTPSISLARKLEKNLNVVLVEEIEDKHVKFKSEESEGLTIGDFIKFKKR